MDHLPPTASANLWLGLDTGGTYTDAALLADGSRVIATAKALTTRENLALGLGDALRRVLAEHPAPRTAISLVSISTTLATNAVVEGHGCPVCTVLIGFDDSMLGRAGLDQALAEGPLVRLRGGHTATGEVAAVLDLDAARQAIAAHGEGAEAFAVASIFAVRNPEHEVQVARLIRELTGKPVTCSHQLSSRLDAPRRALTAILNARLTPHLHRLLRAVEAVLAEEGINAPLMVVKGDGSLMGAQVAREFPVETVLSGPAASVVGAGFLTGLQDFIVADMGGTTTDVAVVTAGQPRIDRDGAVVGGWQTMVEAVAVRTRGLGGDSEVRLERGGGLAVGPRRVLPLCQLAQRWPEVIAVLRRQAASQRPPEFAGRFALRCAAAEGGASLTGSPARLWQALAAGPQPLGELIRNQAGVRALDSLVAAGLVTLAALTPTDAMHVLGRQRDWDSAAAILGATLFARAERDQRQALAAATPEMIAEAVAQHVLHDAGRLVVESSLAHDPGIIPGGASWGLLGERLIDDLVGGRAFSSLFAGGLRLGPPLVAIGAPVTSYYPEIARRLGTRAVIPPHAAVCNAVGAVAGVVTEHVDILVNQPAYQVFRVHDPAGYRDFDQAPPAIEHARRVAADLARAAALQAGAADPAVRTTVGEKRAGSGNDSYLAEATVRATASGRPLAGR